MTRVLTRLVSVVSKIYFNRSMSIPNFRKQPKGFATKAIHAGQEPEQWKSLSVIPMISMSTTFKQHEPGDSKGYVYSRAGNPTRNVLEKCMATLDNAKYGLAFASGLGATTAVLSLLSSGDHLLLGDDIFGGTARLVREVIARMGIEYTFVDPTNLVEVKKAIKPNTKLAFIETPTNPMMKVADIAAITKILRDHKITSVVDNTFLTSYFQRPLELGADIVCYSLTKYMNGHTDIIMGGLTTNCEDLYKRLKLLQLLTGIVPSPFDCYQVNRSLKTLSLRMEQHQKNSLAIARFLEAHPFVERVLHPGLTSHPQHEIALKQNYGCSGVFSFYLKGDLKNSEAFFKALKLFIVAGSLGGPESLVELPSKMSHSSVPLEHKNKLGITDSLIRISVGLEDVDDLIADLQSALDAAKMLNVV